MANSPNVNLAKKRNERKKKKHLISESECFFALTLHQFTLEILITVTHFVPLYFVISTNLHFLLDTIIFIPSLIFNFLKNYSYIFISDYKH